MNDNDLSLYWPRGAHSGFPNEQKLMGVAQNLDYQFSDFQGQMLHVRLFF